MAARGLFLGGFTTVLLITMFTIPANAGSPGARLALVGPLAVWMIDGDPSDD